MADGRRTNGGARPGAGRKAKATEADLQKRLKKALQADGKDRLDRMFQLWVEDTEAESFRIRHAARTSLAAYLYGKPVQRVLVEEDPPDEGRGPVDLSQLNNEELDVLERAGEIITRARRSKGRKGKA
ncbi:MAG TPA: hypothetical protein VF654_16985 [Pyrinomonadaceae bacterium]|jgi:hypothetical protein